MEAAPETIASSLDASSLRPVRMRRAVAAATVGNALEFYDFITFSFFAIQIGNTFFPSHDPFISLMGSLATFGAGFITRPVGAWVLGGYADRHGRKPAMMLSMILMGLAIAGIALVPGYARIGVAAPVLAVLCRLLQGFALGGEVGSATTYMIEAVPDSRRGLSSSWQGTSQNVAASVGALVGLLLSMRLSEQQLTDWGWRLALILGTLIVPFALMIRHSLPETLGREAAKPEVAANVQRYARVAVLGAIVLGMGTIATYIFDYMATYGQATLKLSTTVSMAGEFANNGVGAVVMLIGGWLSDRFGRKPIMLISQGLFVIAIMPCFEWLVTARTAEAFITVNVILSVTSALYQGVLYAAIAESLPPAVRARVFALVYALPIAILGGTTQMVVTWILKVTGSDLSIAWYLTAVSVVGFIAMAFMRESAPVRLAKAQS